MSLNDCSKFAKARKDDYWSRMSYGKVIERNTEHLVIRNDDGYEWAIGYDVVEQELSFHNQYEEEVALTWTELRDKFKKSTRSIITVNFNKKINEKEYIEKLVNLYPNNNGKLKSKKQYESDIKDATKSLLAGEERTMIGRHYGRYKSERILFIDMELENDASKDYDTRIRLVDPRTLNWMICDNVRYIRKNG